MPMYMPMYEASMPIPEIAEGLDSQRIKHPTGNTDAAMGNWFLFSDCHVGSLRAFSQLPCMQHARTG